MRALIVEDSEDDALLLVRGLRRGGYDPAYERVDTPGRMKDALAGGSSWDVIFSDYNMPRFGGREALEIALEASPQTPFIVVSGKVGEDVAVETLKAGAYDYVMKDNLARLCTTVDRSLQEAGERRERMRAQRELRRRDAILDAVRFAADRFLSEATGWEESVRAVLGRLGEATGTSRVYVFENREDEESEVLPVQRHEWQAPGVPPGIPEPPVPSGRRLPYRAGGYERWMRTLGRGEALYGHAREFPEEERWALEMQGILSIVVVPIFVEGRWWGFIGFDECSEEREWSAAEVGALGAAAGTLGAAIRRRQVEEQLRGSEERYRAVIEQATDGIYLLDANSKRLLQTNPAFQTMFGYTADELRGMPVYDFVAHPRENVDATIKRTLEQRRRIVGERKYRRKDGSLVDVEVGVSVISYEGREVICTIVRDVTERKRSEEALARSENRLRTIIETEPECVKVLGMDGSLLEMNPAGLSMIEADSIEQVRGRPVYEYITPEHRTDFVALTERVLRGGSGTLEFELVGLKGTNRWLDTHAVPLRDARGGISGLLAITRDITGRKKNEEALKQSEKLYRAVIEQATDGIFLLDFDTRRFLETNPSFQKILGYTEEELRRMTLYDVVADDDRESIDTNLRRILRQRRRIVGERKYRRKDGSLVDVEVGVSMISYGGKDATCTIVRDVTERAKNEEALRQSERLYRAVIEQATENIFLIDAATRRIVQSNPAFQRALGYGEEELRRMTLYDVVADDRESVDANVRRILEGRGPSVGERKYRRKDGSLLEVEVSANTILLDGRETVCAVAHDVTERARAHRLLEERVVTLSRIAADLTLDLSMEDTLDAMARSVIRASTAVSCSIALLDEETGFLRMEGSHGFLEGFREGMEEIWRKRLAGSPTLRTIRDRRPVFAADMRQRILNNPLYAPIHRHVREATWDTAFIVPLVSRDRALGAIHFNYLPGEEPGEDEMVFLKAVADQAAIAVENARLFSETRGKAALEERQKLARELHDSVSQALYGIALGAKTARDWLAEDASQASEPLDYVLSLAEAGMAEMRALIFELRPESLETEGLVAALEKQAASLTARHGIEVHADLPDEPDAPPEAKEALYRVAQEALHNTVKHARAGSVGIEMWRDDGWISLGISDDGVGFDALHDFPGHLGLRSMRERTSRLGGTLEVETAPGRGTRIRARIPLRDATASP